MGKDIETLAISIFGMGPDNTWAGAAHIQDQGRPTQGPEHRLCFAGTPSSLGPDHEVARIGPIWQ